VRVEPRCRRGKLHLAAVSAYFGKDHGLVGAISMTCGIEEVSAAAIEQTEAQAVELDQVVEIFRMPGSHADDHRQNPVRRAA
jgi:hypothetical protein